MWAHLWAEGVLEGRLAAALAGSGAEEAVAVSGAGEVVEEAAARDGSAA